MRTRLGVLAFALLLSAPSAASAQNPIVASLTELYGVTRTQLLDTAGDLSEEMYAYRPTDEVRSTGEILAHVAYVQTFFCATASGETNPAIENFEETRTTRAAILDALQGSFDYCDGVYGGMTDATAAEERTIPRPDVGFATGASVLAFNAAHNWEHYGNLVTYMRLNGIVPPSSR